MFSEQVQICIEIKRFRSLLAKGNFHVVAGLQQTLGQTSGSGRRRRRRVRREGKLCAGDDGIAFFLLPL